MRVAIIGSFPFHLECIAFLLEIFKKNEINLYVKRGIDNYNYIGYYKTLYKFNVIYNNFSSTIINSHDFVIKLTSNDYCMDDKNIISILHLNGPQQRNCKSTKYISLTPYISDKNISYMFPIFQPILNYSKKKIITLIGHYKDSEFDNDLINFICKNKDYLFNFIVHGSNLYRVQKLKNVNIIRNVDTFLLTTIIQESKYILSKKYIHYDRFSGQLGLAMSFEKPLILDIKTKQSYKLPGISFKKNYSEIVDLNNDERYDRIISEIKEFKNNTLRTSYQLLHSLKN